MDDLENIVAAASRAQNRWASVDVVSQPRENADTESGAKAKWSRVYNLFDARSESLQDEVFGAVNYYFLTNGCSPKGKYRKPIRTAAGTEVSSGEIVKITGRLEGEIRQFLRGRLRDSYMFLKHNAAIKDDDDLCTVAENAGVPRSMCWMLADWLGRDCQYFVGDEATVYNQLRTSKIAAAREKEAVASAGVDHVHAYAPESKMSDRTAQPPNGDLF